MKRGKKSPSFVVELPLRTTMGQEDVLAKRLEAARQIYNACLGEALGRLRRMRESRLWKRARSMPRGHERSELFKAMRKQVRFDGFGLMDVACVHQKAAFKAQLGSHEAQAMASRAFRAVEQYAYGKRGRPRFRGRRCIHSVEGKTNASNIRWDGRCVHWKNLSLPALIAPKDAWLHEALLAKTKYCRIVRRRIRGIDRWFVQLVQEGRTPVKLKHQQERSGGVVGLDIGPSTVAIVGEDKAQLVQFCEAIEQPWKAVRRIERAMDRSRRATNPGNYNANGTVRPGHKYWNKSTRYRQLAVQHSETERKLAAERKRAHGELANTVFRMGTTIRAEKLSYRSFQRNFGRSVKVRAPGMFVSMLKRKAESAGACVEEFPTRTTKLSQVCHGCGSVVKKPLSLRTHQCACGIGPVHRDLYSAFLAQHVRDNRLDACQAQQAWPDVEPLLRRAASSFKKPARGTASAAPQVRASEPVVRQDWKEASPRPRMAYGQVPEGCGEVTSTSRTPRL